MRTKGRRVRTLSGRLSRRFAFLSLASLVGASLLVYASLSWTLSNRQIAELLQKRAAVEHAASELIAAGYASEFKHRFDDFLSGHEGLSLTITGRDGRVAYAGGHSSVTGRLRELAFPIAWRGNPDGSFTARLTIDTRRDDRLLQILAITLGTISLAGALVVSVAGFRLVRDGLEPVRALSEQVETLRLDLRGVRLDGAAQPGELQPLVSSFNDLLGRAERAYEQLEAFNADLAHEMRMPLTSLIGSSELALSRSRPNHELVDVIAHNLDDIRRLSAIVDDMLFLSNADRGGGARRVRVPSVAALMDDIVGFHSAELAATGLTIEVSGDARAALDPGLIRRAVSNLLSNACRHARGETRIVVDIARPAPGTLKITVMNQGNAIAADELPLIFNRFHRGNEARSSAQPHYGLGLAIVAAIARMHGGEPLATSGTTGTAIGMQIEAP